MIWQGRFLGGGACSGSSFLKDFGEVVGGTRRTEQKIENAIKENARQKCRRITPVQPKTPPAQNRGVGPVPSPMGDGYNKNERLYNKRLVASKKGGWPCHMLSQRRTNACFEQRVPIAPPDLEKNT